MEDYLEDGFVVYEVLEEHVVSLLSLVVRRGTIMTFDLCG